MSKQQRYTEEFKLAAVKQVTERNYPVAEVAERLGISSHSLYAWIKRYSQPEAQQHDSSQQAEIRRLKAELRRDIAVSRLGTSKVSFSELAADLGFADAAAFQRAFKTWTGSSPGLYRARPVVD